MSRKGFPIFLLSEVGERTIHTQLHNRTSSSCNDWETCISAISVCFNETLHGWRWQRGSVASSWQYTQVTFAESALLPIRSSLLLLGSHHRRVSIFRSCWGAWETHVFCICLLGTTQIIISMDWSHHRLVSILLESSLQIYIFFYKTDKNLGLCFALTAKYFAL